MAISTFETLPCDECGEHDALYILKPENMAGKPLCRTCLMLWDGMFDDLDELVSVFWSIFGPKGPLSEQ